MRGGCYTPPRMNPYLPPLIGIGAVYLAMIVLNERIGIFRCDRFASPLAKWLAYALLGLFMISLGLLVTSSALNQPTPKQLAATPFWELFGLHIILILFLCAWWLLTRRPPLAEFLNIQREHRGEAVLTGLAVGVGGWILTLLMAFVIALILSAFKLMPQNPRPPAIISFLIGLPLWKKMLIVLSAMTVEEAFFRGWLQKRVGLVASTGLFAMAHLTMGQPFVLIGVSIISIVIGVTFYRTRNLIPGIIAHGVFDAVQLFVIIPVVYRMGMMGS